KHILRSVNQDCARSDTLAKLGEEEVYVERDWAMKFLQMVYRESQSKWFAKRGINWHISVGTFFLDGEMSSHTIVHLFDNATQDAVTSNAILLDTLRKLHEIKPNLVRAYLRSDNAGCFHSYSSIFGIKSINGESPIKVERVDFADPQGGKSICDRRAAHLKSTIRKFVNEGNDVRSAADFLCAVKKSNTVNTSIVVAIPPPSKVQGSKVLKQCPLKNITSLYNFSFEEEGMKVWKQYGIGCGQFIPYLLCFDEGNSQIAELKMLENFNSPIRNKTITQRPEGPSTNDDTNVSDDQPAPNVDGDTDNGLFSCPEPNCIRSFSKYGNLMHHLDVGNHSFMKKGLSLSDRSIINYATKIESKVASKPQMESSSLVPNPTSLTKGWALKNKREIKRFSENQKQFLQSKFDMGERSGLKCDPEDVSNEMRAVRNKDGTRIFSIDDFLSASQIASYFSRLCLLKRKRSLEVLEEEDFEAAEFENNFQDLNSLAKQ
ncbi:hypothetical protein FSP39_014148, partial [Pinctada imbricata]